MEKIITYIIRFLLGPQENEKLYASVGYTSDPQTYAQYKVVIVPSAFFEPGTYKHTCSYPKLPLQQIEHIPLLYGSAQTKKIGTTRIVYADLIASSFFLLSRYEEIIRRDTRDAHGRFPGKESLPYKAGFIHRPIVDEYGKLLRQWLREEGLKVSEPAEGIRKVYLTHDVDAPYACRTIRNLIREVFSGKSLFQSLKYYTGPLANDPYFTFPWLIQQDLHVQQMIGAEGCQTIYFIKSGAGDRPEDKPLYKLHSKDIQTLLCLLRQQDITIGLHCSYEAGINPSLIAEECAVLKNACGKPVHYNRHHFLSIREPEDTAILEKNGITHDFTMGYADWAGFRLGTSRPVHYIDPVHLRLSTLLLHPLTIMECSLDGKNYMGLDFHEAKDYCMQLIDRIAEVNGDLVLLWHNDTVSPFAHPTWQRNLYTALLEYITRKVYGPRQENFRPPQ